MRLLNVRTMVIKEYQASIPPYAILSHTWGDGEVSFVDFAEGIASSRNGYKKILGCCKRAEYDGLEYVWIDTCCIDKRSSVELSEAINSMFNWYRDSTVCYAYLEDVSSEEIERYKEVSTGHYSPSRFKHIRWLTRGWTLQELIAPSVLVFFTSDWVDMGSRDELKYVIAEAANIDPDFFRFGQLNDFSIAQRMSWASHRQTSRIEDQAYCLLGIFGVTMPLVYGEGKRAFVRLQEEIIKESDDQSIFAWCSEDLQYQDPNLVNLTHGGLLAPSPLYFANSGNIVRCDNIVRCRNAEYGPTSPYIITNKGIQITLPVIEAKSKPSLPFTRLQEKRRDISPVIWFRPSDIVAVLNCQSTDTRSQIVIFLREKESEQTYIRTIHWFELASLPQTEIRTEAQEKQIFIRAHNASNTTPLWLRYKHEKLIIIEAPTSDVSGFRFIRVEPEVRWQLQETGALFLHVPYESNEVILSFEHPAGGAFGLAVDPWGYSMPRIENIHMMRNFELPDDTDSSQHDQHTSEYREFVNGHRSLRLNARQAAHAYIIKIESFTISDRPLILNGQEVTPSHRVAITTPPNDPIKNKSEDI